MTCTATGTASAAFPVTVNQCNGSETGGGSFVTCTTTITTNVFDTGTALATPAGTPGGPTTGTPTPTAGVPGSPPFVELPPTPPVQPVTR